MQLCNGKGNVMEEVWLPLKGIVECGDNYELSNTGKVRNIITGRIIKQRLKNSGYLQVDLRFNSKRKTYMIHRLVALAFIKQVKGKETVNHINGNKADNFVYNLEWASNGEQLKHASDLGLRPNKAHKPVNQIALNGEIIATYESGHEASKATGIVRETIYTQCRNLYKSRTHPFYFRFSDTIQTG